MRNRVPFMYGNVAVDSDMEIDIKIQPHFAGTAFLHVNHARDRSGGLANGRDNFAARRGIHDFIKRRSQKPNAICGDDGAGEKRRPIIRALPTTAADQGGGDADECGGGRKRVAAMMPGIGLHGRALDVAPDTVDVTEQNFLYYNHYDQYPERERRRSVVRRKNFAHAFNCQTECGRENANGHNRRSDRFGLAVSVGMRFIRWPRRKFQSAPNHERASDIESGLDSVGDQDVGVAERTAENFRCGENQVHEHAEKRDARTGLQILLRRLSLRCHR